LKYPKGRHNKDIWQKSSRGEGILFNSQELLRKEWMDKILCGEFVKPESIRSCREAKEVTTSVFPKYKLRRNRTVRSKPTRVVRSFRHFGSWEMEGDNVLGVEVLKPRKGDRWQ
jgi:hypothetical protein